jgi:hypothetical protein
LLALLRQSIYGRLAGYEDVGAEAQERAIWQKSVKSPILGPLLTFEKQRGPVCRERESSAALPLFSPLFRLGSRWHHLC